MGNSTAKNVQADRAAREDHHENTQEGDKFDIPREVAPAVLLDMLEPCLHNLRILGGYDPKKLKSDIDIRQRSTSDQCDSAIDAMWNVLDNSVSLTTLLQFNKMQWNDLQKEVSLKAGPSEEKGRSQFYGTLGKDEIVKHVKYNTIRQSGDYMKGVLKKNDSMSRRFRTDTRQILIEETLEVLQPLKDKEGVIESLVERNASLIDRLAAEMNTNISKNESSLENISLSNRPLKIAEEYSLVTSNEWLEAKTQLDEEYGDDPKEEAWKLEALCNILLKSEEQANEAYEKFMESLGQRLKNPFQTLNKPNADRQFDAAMSSESLIRHNLAASDDMEAKLPTAVTNAIGDYFKTLADFTDISAMYKGMVASLSQKDDNLKNAISVPAVRDYAKQCLRLAWKMVIQRPKMCFKADMIGKQYPGDTQLDLAWGSEPGAKCAVIRYYKHPSLLHGDKTMVKGSVFVN